MPQAGSFGTMNVTIVAHNSLAHDSSYETLNSILVVFISTCLAINQNNEVWSPFGEGEQDRYVLKKINISDTPLRCLLICLFLMLGSSTYARGRFSSCACPRESSARAS